VGASAPSVILIAVIRELSLSGVLERNHHAVLQVPTGKLALEWARSARPDAIILEADLPDMSGIEACRQLHGDLRVGPYVPILILFPDQPTPEQRVAALRAGAWDCIRHPGDLEELSLKLQTFVEARRNLDLSREESFQDQTVGLHDRQGLARRARELGALMARKHGALACVVFAIEKETPDPAVGIVVARTARLSDVVGTLGATEFAVLAPGTTHVGAVRLAKRVATVLSDKIGGGGRIAPGVSLQVGYEAVENLKYWPMDPVALLAQASAAVRNGKPDSEQPWVRRFDPSVAAGLAGGSRLSPVPGAISV